MAASETCTNVYFLCTPLRCFFPMSLNGTQRPLPYGRGATAPWQNIVVTGLGHNPGHLQLKDHGWQALGKRLGLNVWQEALLLMGKPSRAEPEALRRKALSRSRVEHLAGRYKVLNVQPLAALVICWITGLENTSRADNTGPDGTAVQLHRFVFFGLRNFATNFLALKAVGGKNTVFTTTTTTEIFYLKNIK